MKSLLVLLALLFVSPAFSQEEEADKMEFSEEDAAKLQEAFQAMFTSNLNIELEDDSFQKGITNCYVSEDKEAMVNLMLAPQGFEKLAADFEKESIGSEKIQMTHKEKFEVNGKQVLMQEGVAEDEENGKSFVTQIFAMEHGEQSIMVSVVFPKDAKEDIGPMMRKALATVTVE